MHDQNDQHDRHIRTTIPDAWNRRLGSVAAQLGVHRNELLREAVALLLHRLGHGDEIRVPNLPEPEVRP